MFVPISGYLYDSGDIGESVHSHNLRITSWDGNPVHIHQFSGETSYDIGHSHMFAGTTEPAPGRRQHTHRYFVYTSISDGHIHQIRGVTGPAIYLPNGRHYHEFQGVTTVDGLTQHSHVYRGRTSG
ncbi:YmaF family protein [Bacillus dakarensis]|uniref:YmaF family protein n=1 Tax=Robertmurraya dakarensis TaxID=1926278 RepID=UPI00098102DD|nr:YmaF family protein [Bacillus dakarensis]